MSPKFKINYLDILLAVLILLQLRNKDRIYIRQMLHIVIVYQIRALFDAAAAAAVVVVIVVVVGMYFVD